jgi:hypothetical protein
VKKAWKQGQLIICSTCASFVDNHLGMHIVYSHHYHHLDLNVTMIVSFVDNHLGVHIVIITITFI